ncbi:MAG: tetratricopeptide repeat protein [Bacteroidales bacterium]|nr:tetratricopeptide repeat protein [Bacteroidales bacterium]
MNKCPSFLRPAVISVCLVSAFSSIRLLAQDTSQRQADSLLISAVEQYQKGNDVRAKHLLEQAGSLDPQNDAVQYYLGCLALSSRDVAAATDHFEQAYVKDTTNTWYGMRLAQLYNASGRVQAAEGIYESLLKRKPGDLNVLPVLADIYMQVGKYDKADSVLTRLERIGGHGEYIALSRIELNRQRGDFKEFFGGLNEFFSNTDVQPQVKRDIMERLLKSSDPRFNFFHLNDYDTLLTTCMQTHPGDTSFTHFAGDFYYSAGKSDRLQTLCRKYPDDAHMLSLSLYDYIKKQDFQSALPVCDALLYQVKSGNGLAGNGAVDNGELASVLTARGDCHYNLGASGKAFRDYGKALKMDPENPVVLNNYAYYLSVSGKNLGKALKMSQKAVIAAPENATYLDTYGWILYRQRKYAEAKAVFKKVMVFGGKENPEVLRHYAAVLDALDEKALADAYRRQAEMKENGKKK